LTSPLRRSPLTRKSWTRKPVKTRSPGKLPDEEVFGAAEKILFGKDKRPVVSTISQRFWLMRF